MAGEVRQPIDQASFERYIDAQVPSIKTPLTIKQVIYRLYSYSSSYIYRECKLTAKAVWIRAEQPDVPAHLRRRGEIRSPQEATGQAAVQDGAPSRARVPDHPCAGEDRRTRAADHMPVRGRERDRHAVLYHGVSGREDLCRPSHAGRGPRRKTRAVSCFLLIFLQMLLN